MQIHKASLAAPALLILAFSLFSGAARAQSLSSDLSGSLSEQTTDTTGLDSSYAEGAGAIGTTFHEDVTDATHADILSSSMSPAVSGISTSSEVSADANSFAPPVNALQLSDPNTGSSKTAGDDAFSSAGSFNGTGFSASNGFGKSAGDGAFRVSLTNGPSVRGSLGHATGAARPGMTEQSGSGEESAGVDPVLLTVTGIDTGGSSGSATVAVAQPTADAAAFFASSNPVPAAYQFDDGATPPLTAQVEPGRMMPASTQYSPPPNGFADSTLGQAGLPLDTAEIHAPGGLKTSAGFGLPTSSEGPNFEIKTGIVPNLYAVVQKSPSARMRVQQDRIFEQNIVNGMDVTDAEEARRTALERDRGHSSSRHDLLNAQGQEPGQSSLLPDTAASAKIR